jgi:2-polyprenyl-3-methyl-5-hydroxy-6-metoxy-1,4-benzoquinol methylase
METSLHERANSGLHDSLLAHIPQSIARDAPILDVGCGTGAWLARLHGQGFSNLTGLDLDMQQVGVDGVKVHQADLNKPDWAGLTGPYKLITAIEVIEHIENIGVFLDRLEALLAPDGVILLTTPNVESLASRLRFLVLNELKQFDTLGDPTHIFPVLTHTLPRFLARRSLYEVERWGFPEGGRTTTSRGIVNAIAAALRVFLPEPNQGDNLCIRLALRK